MSKKVYHYTECGLDDVWISGIEPQVDETGKVVITIRNLPGLHRAISRSIVFDLSGMSGAQLRFLRTELGLTQDQMAGILHKEALTISRWERGENPIDHNAMTVIRLLAIERLELGAIEGVEKLSMQSTTIARNSRVQIDGSDPANYRLEPRVAA